MPRKTFNLKTAVIHERHEKTRKIQKDDADFSITHLVKSRL